VIAPHVRHLLVQAREEELGSDERAHIHVHLISCEACRSFETALARNDMALASRELVYRLPALSSHPSNPVPRLLGVASLGVVAVVLSLTIGLALGQWREDRSRQIEPQSAAAKIPGALALAPSSPSSGFGLISTQGNQLLVRSEASPDPRIVLSNALSNVAVAPDGRSVAVWLRGELINNRFAWSLHVLDAIDGTMGPPLVTTLDEVPYGLPRWSSDGTGLIAGTQTPVFRSPQRPGGTTHNSWFAIDVSTSAVSRLGTLEVSLATEVYAWDRQRDLITAGGVVANADLFTYLIVHGGTVQTFQLPPRYAVRAADGYAGFLVIAGLAACSGQAGPECLHLAIHDQATFGKIATLSPLTTTVQQLQGIVFRPRSQDLIVSLMEPNRTVRDELWSDLGRGPRRLLAESANAPDRGAVNGIIPRADGSAAFILRFDPSGTGRWYGVLVSLNDNTQMPFEIRTGGNPLASVVLDPAFARAMVSTGLTPSNTPGRCADGRPQSEITAAARLPYEPRSPLLQCVLIAEGTSRVYRLNDGRNLQVFEHVGALPAKPTASPVMTGTRTIGSQSWSWMSVNGQTILSTTLPDRVYVELSIPMRSNTTLRLEPESPSARALVDAEVNLLQSIASTLGASN
jgi:hypothetical protein